MRQLKVTKSITSRDSKALARYLQEIGHMELLTVDQEVELSQKIREGGPEASIALDKLVNANLRFVVTVAKQYQNSGMSLLDLINEGNIGLIKAAQRFDDTRGFKFISYAVWWIRQSILLAISEKSRMVRLPLNQDSSLSKINKAISKFEQLNGRRPSDEELAEILDISADKVSMARSTSGKHISVDAPFSEGEDGSLLDVLPNEGAEMSDESVNKESLMLELNRVLSQLNTRECEIVKMSYGIGCPEMTLDEISAKYELSRERVRQIKEKAIRRLRGQKSTLLRAYLG